MSSLIELETFISVGEKADAMAKIGVSDYDSEAYKIAFVAHFKSLLRSKPYDFCVDFLDCLSKNLNAALEENSNVFGLYYEFGYIKQHLKFLPYDLEYALKLEKMSHGGARPNAGRKKAAPTTQVRIDSELAHLFKSISDDFRANPEKSKRIIEQLSDIG